ncbi:carotenoid-cleaving dioxygenase, mitochondrial-like [Asterias amurensis]|uniref:carotenoid-cleaving dioxygenase, mitochondrial-like n=1 Tax=Asterias amurensis TaxID=7602 RepID=UPI003AB612C5
MAATVAKGRGCAQSFLWHRRPAGVCKKLFQQPAHRGQSLDTPNEMVRCASGAGSRGVMYKSVAEQPDPVTTTITGTVPTWINGDLLRNGPGKFEVGKDTYNHLFDGLSLLTRFNISNGKVTYQSKFQRSNSYTKAMEHNRIVLSEFGTMAHPDPCLSLLGRFMARFKPQREFSDNCNVNLAFVGDQCYAMTESHVLRKIDPRTLDTLDKVNLADSVAVHTATAHPHMDPDGTVYNMGSHFAKKTMYNIIKVPPPEPGMTEDPMSKASILCSIPSTETYPSYYHSFSMTDNYIVFLEQPLFLNLLRMRMHMLFQTGFQKVMQYDEKKPARFHIARRDTGELLPQRFVADPFFCFHQVNAYEEDGHVVVDLSTYEDGKIVQKINLENLRKGVETEVGTAKRFVLPVEKEKESGINLNTLEYSKTTAVLRDDDTIYCTPEVISDETIEFPKVNYEKFNGKPYQYFYGIGGTDLELMKVNTRTATSQRWHEEGCCPSEPIFVNAPNSTSEDDGVVLSAVNDLREGKPPFLLVLDARDFKEVARAEIMADVPFGFHGMYVSN